MRWLGFVIGGASFLLGGCSPADLEGASVNFAEAGVRVRYCWEIKAIDGQEFPDCGVHVVLSGWPTDSGLKTVIYDDTFYQPQTVCRDLEPGHYRRTVDLGGRVVEDKEFDVSVPQSVGTHGPSSAASSGGVSGASQGSASTSATPGGSGIAVGQNGGTISVLIVSDSPGAVITFQSPNSLGVSGGGNGTGNSGGGGGSGATGNAVNNPTPPGTSPLLVTDCELPSFAAGTTLGVVSGSYGGSPESYLIDVALMRNGVDAISQVLPCQSIVRVRVTTDYSQNGQWITGLYQKTIDAPFGGELQSLGVTGVRVPVNLTARIRMEVFADPDGSQENLFGDDVLVGNFTLDVPDAPDPR